MRKMCELCGKEPAFWRITMASGVQPVLACARCTNESGGFRKSRPNTPAPNSTHRLRPAKPLAARLLAVAAARVVPRNASGAFAPKQLSEEKS